MLPDTPRFRSRLDLLYLVTREFNAGLDIDHILRRVMETSVAAASASDATLCLFNSKGELESHFVFSGFKIEKLAPADIKEIPEQKLINRVKNQKEGIIIKDAGTDERWPDNPATRNVGSVISIPIQVPDQIIGVLTITAGKPDFFANDDLAMLTIVVDQAAFAIANARLFTAEQRRRRLADTLAAVAHTINSSLDLNNVLNLILEQLALVVEYDSSSIFLFDDEKERHTLIIRAARGFDNLEEALKMTIPIMEGTLNYRAITKKLPVIVGDVQTEPSWVSNMSSRNIRSWVGMPLVQQAKVIGMLTIDSLELNKYNDENVNDITAFADQAATAVANAQTVTMLQNAEASYTALFEDSTDIIIITNYQGLILNVNRKTCHKLRRTKDALVNGSIDFINPRLGSYLVEQTKQLKQWREASIELDVVDAYRETVSLEIIARQVHYEGKDCVQWVGRDISARKEVEKMRQDLFNMVVHDLRGPVGNLVNAVELMTMMIKLEVEHNPALQKVINMTANNGREVRDLLTSMLDISHLEGGKFPLQYSMVLLDEIIGLVQEQTIPRAKAKEMELVFNPTPEIPKLYLDESMIRRVLINLIDNSIKYTPAQGKIIFTSTVEGDNLHLTILDNGAGISKEDQTRIFNKFSRVAGASKVAYGVGLGLAFCKLAVEAHNGTISVESDGVGQGSSFQVSIPMILKPTEETTDEP